MPLECAICLNEYEKVLWTVDAEKPLEKPSEGQTPDGKVIKMLDCKHSFCAICIDEWLSKSATCPSCRVDVVLPIVNATVLRERRRPEELSEVSERIGRLVLALRRPPRAGNRPNQAQRRDRRVASLRNQLAAIEDDVELQEIFVRVVRQTHPERSIDELEAEIIASGRQLTASEFERLYQEGAVAPPPGMDLLARLRRLFICCQPAER